MGLTIQWIILTIVMVAVILIGTHWIIYDSVLQGLSAFKKQQDDERSQTTKVCNHAWQEFDATGPRGSDKPVKCIFMKCLKCNGVIFKHTV